MSWFAKRPSKYYLESPFRCNWFIGESLMLLGDIFLVAVILIRFWNRLPPSTIFLLGVVVFGMLEMWISALRYHKEVRWYLKTAQIEPLEAGTHLDDALSHAAVVTFQGLFHAFLLVGTCLAALGELYINSH